MGASKNSAFAAEKTKVFWSCVWGSFDSPGLKQGVSWVGDAASANQIQQNTFCLGVVHALAVSQPPKHGHGFGLGLGPDARQAAKGKAFTGVGFAALVAGVTVNRIAQGVGPSVQPLRAVSGCGVALAPES
jgi:hypothetical protein